MIKSLYWKNSCLYILNQKILPRRIKYLPCRKYEEVAECIREMVIRVAPAIGIAAAFGIVLAGKEKKFSNSKFLNQYIRKACNDLKKTRPTAVNLFWAIERMQEKLKSLSKETGNIGYIQKRLEEEAKRILAEDIEMNKKIGAYGAKLLKKNSVVITHCNAGALATGGYGTAIGVITSGWKSGKIKMVYVDETRPYLQGARLTALELKQQGIPYRLICDNMAGHIMKTEKVSAVIVGADRISKNGDTANKIGTYSLAVLAKYHNVKFYVAAPGSTIDRKISSGSEIPVEERAEKEVTTIFDRLIVPKGTRACHPAFDVTPSKLISAIITEKGIFKYPYSF